MGEHVCHVPLRIALLLYHISHSAPRESYGHVSLFPPD